jgi:hypothetical protein
MMKYGFAVALLALTPPVLARSDSADDLHYRVMRGDTLEELAHRGLKRLQDYRVIQHRNGIRDPGSIRVGTNLRIPRRILRIEPVSGRVVALRGNVEVDGKRAVMGMLVNAGHTIRTGAVSFLTMELADTSVLTVPSNSRMDVLSLGKILLTGSVERRFLLRGGRVETQVSPLKSRGDSFEIRTPAATASVRGTRYRVTYQDSAAVAGVSVLQGAVAVTGDRRDLLLGAGHGVAIDENAMRAPEALLPPPQMRDADALQDAAQVSFHLGAVPGAAVYRAQMATDAGFVDLFAEVDATKSEIEMAGIPDGSFFARFSAISESGIEGRPATFTVERRRNDVTAEVGSAPDCPAKRCLLFRWRSNGEGDRTYRFQLSRSPEGVPVLDEPGMSGTQIVVTDLAPGTYVWRVESSGQANGRAFAKWSDFEELRVAPLER